ncbi:hypothetical protein ACF08N_16365 [Streptomyces sp. NPDC015127]|uniref:hypothetical protein n=1 Tax=Streptomyces sp. NPDC015127 TaxID=3364939 RepID=UPI003703060B
MRRTVAPGSGAGREAAGADPTDKRARLVCGAEKASAAKRVADAVVAEVEQEWEAHIGTRRKDQLREALTLLRDITDPWALRRAHNTFHA